MLKRIESSGTSKISTCKLRRFKLLERYDVPHCRRMGPVISHNKGGCCLNMNPLYRRTFILSAIACPLVIHSIN